MRHRRKNTQKFTTWVQKKELVIRNLITSLVTHWEIVTTPKKAKVLKTEMDKFMSNLIRMFDKYTDENDVKRESIRLVKKVIFTEEAWKKIIAELLPKYKEEWRKSWFISDYKLGFRPWDAAEKILVRLV